MNLLKKFETGKQNRTFTRIDPRYDVDIFIGYDDDGRMSLAVIEKGETVSEKSTNIIEETQGIRNDGKLQLKFSLLDSSYKPMFLTVCRDIIEYCCQKGKGKAIQSASERWKYWREVFANKKENILSENEIKGLLGELVVLNEHFMSEYDEKTAVSAWMGPLMGHKDFEINNTWYEVKTVNQNASEVHISSLEQLDSPVEGHLVVVQMEKTNEVNNLAININDYVSLIENKITDLNLKEEFWNRLTNVGYEYNEEYKKFNFVYYAKTYYTVKDDFPRLTRDSVNRKISSAEYSILLDGIENFKESK